MMIKQPTPILRKPKIIFLFDDFTGTAGCAMVACNGFSGIGGTAVVDVVASAALVVAVVVVGVGVSTGVDVTVELCDYVTAYTDFPLELLLGWMLAVLPLHRKHNRTGRLVAATYRIFYRS